MIKVNLSLIIPPNTELRCQTVLAPSNRWKVQGISGQHERVVLVCLVDETMSHLFQALEKIINPSGSIILHIL